MRRREVIAGVAATTVGPLAGRAQQQIPVIGFLGAASAKAFEPRLIPLRQALKDAGFIEGENVRIEYRWVEAQYERLPALVAELVRMPVTVIVAAGGAQTALAAKSATAKIPIVFQNGSDPVKIGLVASLNRPGGNVTGVTNVSVETAAKRLELMRELVPTAAVLGWMLNPRNPNTEAIAKDVERAAAALGRKIVFANFAKRSDLDLAFATLVQQGAQALVVSADPIFTNWRDELIKGAAYHKLPTMLPDRTFVEVGGLASYGSNYSDVYREVGAYVARILKGERPAELPVVQSTKYELIVNNKTARALGLEVPLSFLMRIDAVID